MTEFQKFLLAFVVIAGFFLIGGFSYKFGDKHGYNRGYNAYHPTDTVYKDSLIYKDKLVEVIKWKEKEKPVPIYIKVDSLIHDTTYVALPREFKMYADSTFEAQVSGIDPTLDWIKIHQKTAYITQTVVQNKPYDWTLSLFGEGEFIPNSIRGRVGLIYERSFYKDFSWYTKAGYEYGNAGQGWFIGVGGKITFAHN